VISAKIIYEITVICAAVCYAALIEVANSLISGGFHEINPK
jgi:hypothetical protein